MNDGEAGNDADTLEAKEARDAAEGKPTASARSGVCRLDVLYDCLCV